MTVAAVFRAPMISPRAVPRGVVGVRASVNERDDARLDRFCAVPDGAFVWTRHGGDFHLGRLAGPCRRDDSPEAAVEELTHLRPCDWLPEPIDAGLVPEAVSYAFSRGGRNFQGIGLPGVGEATAGVWDLLA